jgi:hypothetical protein
MNSVIAATISSGACSATGRWVGDELMRILFHNTVS